jgi:hypothetical protein
MHNPRIEQALYWLRNNTNRGSWAAAIVIATFLSVIFMLIMGMIASKVEPSMTIHAAAAKPTVVHVLDENIQEIPTVPAECLTALDKADAGYSRAYFQVLKNKHLNKHDLRDLTLALDKQVREYKQYAEICRRMADY